MGPLFLEDYGESLRYFVICSLHFGGPLESECWKSFKNREKFGICGFCVWTFGKKLLTLQSKISNSSNILLRIMVNYKDLGLVNTREMFKRAVAGGYAIPAFNFNTMEQMQAIVMAAVETKSPVIMQVSKGARNYANATILRYMAEGAVAYAKEPWLRVLWLTLRNWVVSILRSCCTSTMVTASSSVRTVSTWASQA